MEMYKNEFFIVGDNKKYLIHKNIVYKYEYETNNIVIKNALVDGYINIEKLNEFYIILKKDYTLDLYDNDFKKIQDLYTNGKVFKMKIKNKHVFLLKNNRLEINRFIFNDIFELKLINIYENSNLTNFDLKEKNYLFLETKNKYLKINELNYNQDSENYEEIENGYYLLGKNEFNLKFKIIKIMNDSIIFFDYNDNIYEILFYKNFFQLKKNSCLLDFKVKGLKNVFKINNFLIINDENGISIFVQIKNEIIKINSDNDIRICNYNNKNLIIMYKFKFLFMDIYDLLEINFYQIEFKISDVYFYTYYINSGLKELMIKIQNSQNLVDYYFRTYNIFSKLD